MVGEALPLGEHRRGVGILRYRFKPDRQWRVANGVTGYVDGVDALTFIGDLAIAREADRRTGSPAGCRCAGRARSRAGRAAEIGQLALAYPSRDDMVLQLGAMTAPYEQLQACINGLICRWGYDPAACGALQRTPRVQNAREIVHNLLAALRRARLAHNDSIHLRLEVDEQGAASRCIVQQPRRGSEIETLVCDTVRGTARFDPAIDGDGGPARAPYVTAIQFGIG